MASAWYRTTARAGAYVAGVEVPASGRLLLTDAEALYELTLGTIVLDDGTLPPIVPVFRREIPTGGAAGQVLAKAGPENFNTAWRDPSSSGGGGGLVPWTLITAGRTAVAGDRLLCNTSSSAITVALPASPAAGAEVSFLDFAETFDVNNLTVARNGSSINGENSDLIVDVKGAEIRLVFKNATWSW